jgi:hypothetical protein
MKIDHDDNEEQRVEEPQIAELQITELQQIVELQITEQQTTEQQIAKPPVEFVDEQSLELSLQDKHKGPRSRSSHALQLVEKFVVRLPAGLREQIKQLSDQNHRSMNCEIVTVLESYIRQQFVEQMIEINSDNPSIQPQVTDIELQRRLETLPKAKKAALLELLG